MFILRRIDGETNCEFNKVIGDEYHIIYKSHNSKEFTRHPYIADGKGVDVEKIFALILYIEKGFQDVWPLYDGSSYYVMTGAGNTFAAIYNDKLIN